MDTTDHKKASSRLRAKNDFFELNTTPEQLESFIKLMERFDYEPTRDQMSYLIGDGGCVIVEFPGIFIGIERDGYAHS